MAVEPFDVVDLIRTKRDKGVLTTEQITWLVDAYTRGYVADEQMSAMTMAIFLNGMERTEIRDEAGTSTEVDLWTTCFTPRELRLLAARAGLAVDHLWSVRPGEYGPNPPDLVHEEFLVVGHRPA